MKFRPVLLASIPVLFAAGMVMLSRTDAQAATNSSEKKGSFELIKVHGASLEGNLEGDSADRDVYVYLPPSYATSKNRRYPVVYFLHGYGVKAEAYWNLMMVPEAADRAMNSGAVHEMIVVNPDAYTLYAGSMYSNSPTTGNWEAYLTHDLVSYIDSHYRTIANRDSRGLAGHSMGGYGTMRLAMKYPEVFASVYAMSSCCLMNNPGAQGRGPARAPAREGAAAPAREPSPANAGNSREGRGRGRGGFGDVQSAEGAAWSPNPQNPPKFLDLPVQDGVVKPEIAAKWVANSPLAMVDQYVPNLKKYRAIMLDVGLQDGLAASNKQMDESLTRLGVTHTFQTYEGDHMSGVKARFEANVLPFFSQNLSTTAPRGKK